MRALWLAQPEARCGYHLMRSLAVSPRLLFCARKESDEEEEEHEKTENEVKLHPPSLTKGRQGSAAGLRLVRAPSGCPLGSLAQTGQIGHKREKNFVNEL